MVGSIEELVLLNRHFDSGHEFSSRTIASIILRMVNEEIMLSQLRRRIGVKSFASNTNEQSATDIYHLASIGMTSTGPKIFPYVDENIPRPVVWVGVEEWLRGQAFTEGLSERATRATREGYENPSKLKRRMFSRLDILKTARNEEGAHFDRSKSAASLFLEATGTGMQFVMSEAGPRSTLTRGTFIGNIGAATIRSMSTEIIRSFDIKRQGPDKGILRFHDLISTEQA